MKKQLDTLGQTGAIMNIVTSAGLILYALLFGIIGLFIMFSSSYTEDVYAFVIIGVICLVFFVMNTIALLLNIQVMKGKLNKKVAAVVFGFLTGSLLGAIFLIVGKEEQSNRTSLYPTHHVKSMSETLDAYKSLLDSGTITEDEFIKLKQDLLNKK